MRSTTRGQGQGHAAAAVDAASAIGRRCRLCSGVALQEIVSLGRMPLANQLVEPAAPGALEARYPLDLAFCPACTLVQITETVAPELLFRDYVYLSSFSDTVLRSAESLVQRLVRERRLGADSLALEVASNDGYLLQYYQRAGVPVQGVDPARNIARIAREERGVPTIDEFFDAALAQRLVEQGHLADVVHANNVLAHAADLNGLVRGMAIVLKADGVAVIEVPYVRDLIEHVEFDTIYHEHLCYFSLTALVPLFARHGLQVQDVERLAIHGGSLRLFAGRAASRSDAVCRLLDEERALGMGSVDFYRRLGAGAQSTRHALRELLTDLKRRGQRVAAYGAAAKGAVLLNFCGLDGDWLDYVVDRNPHKQGRRMPGIGLPIHAPEHLLHSRPDYLLILAWNIASEIIAQQHAYAALGGRFIVPVPTVRIVGPDA